MNKTPKVVKLRFAAWNFEVVNFDWLIVGNAIFEVEGNKKAIIDERCGTLRHRSRRPFW